MAGLCCMDVQSHSQNRRKTPILGRTGTTLDERAVDNEAHALVISKSRDVVAAVVV